MAKTREKRKKKNKDDKLKLSTGKKEKKLLPQKLLNRLSRDKKVEYLMKHGDMIKDSLFNEVTMKKGIIKKEALAFGPKNFMTKDGKLKKIRRANLQFFDHILMEEFNIDSSKMHSKHKHKRRDNNNDMDASNQNNTESSSKHKSKGTGKTHAKNHAEEVIEIEIAGSPVNSSMLEETQKDSKKRKHKTAKKNEDLDQETEEILVNRLQNLRTVQIGSATVYLGEYECDYCGNKYTTKSSLRRHISMHFNVKPYQCRYCPLKFGQSCNWRTHMRRKHPDKKVQDYICNKCQKPFFKKKNYLLHLQSHSDKTNKHKCAFCDKGFPSHLLLSQHEKEHMAPGRFKCSVCSMSYSSRVRFSHHIKNHVELKDLICHYCGKQFLQPSSVKRHIQVSHGGIRVQCPICKKKLKGHLTEHMRTHENDRPHKCEECGQRFTQSTQLNVHKRSHTGARPYPCRICKRPFSHSNALMLHIRRHTGEKPFQCTMCHLSFSQLPHMKSHMRNIHGKEKFYKCDMCNEFFKLKAELDLHRGNCVYGDFAFVEKVGEAEAIESEKNISKMRFLLALLFTKIATKEKLKYLGFNKRLIDDILVETVEAMGHTPCTDMLQSPFIRLRNNIAILMQRSVPKQDQVKFRKSKKTTEEILELLTSDKN